VHLVLQLEDIISALEAELRYLNAMLAVPAPVRNGHWRWPVPDIVSGC
jgi:hypothetical protein